MAFISPRTSAAEKYDPCSCRYTFCGVPPAACSVDAACGTLAVGAEPLDPPPLNVWLWISAIIAPVASRDADANTPPRTGPPNAAPTRNDSTAAEMPEITACAVRAAFVISNIFFSSSVCADARPDQIETILFASPDHAEICMSTCLCNASD